MRVPGAVDCTLFKPGEVRGGGIEVCGAQEDFDATTTYTSK